MASFYDLPKEVVEEIMSRVPAISVLRFKCVNKYWHALISALINDQIFVSKHLDYAKNNCHASLIFSDECPHLDHRWIDCDESCKLLLITMVNDSEIDNIRVALEFLKLPLIQNETGYMWQGILDIRQCDGIILLVKDKQTLVLCNPILHEFKILPASKYDPIDSFVELASPFGVGFGYDHRANVYKTIRVFYDHDNTTERAERLNVGPLRGIAFLLSLWSSTDELLMVGKDGRLVSYNLGTQKLRDVTAHGGEIIRRAHFVLPFLYVKSLVSVRDR
ncbi:Putative F-box protein [Morus notabilis]|uniref:Putative F-box protein n=1 Tax=Morus notabilis TaxID=981085 RepID=W9QZK8_9ROSA|nr:putative F-box/LRR-repeat/kelch-repeat protein At1g11620 [Morus notabilis]EXB60967.1 Putative F-box protein [Morus notabilis]EXB74685.1 Putative F-box protein [Morus notabilis]